ncbi:MAG: hypothetical protein H0W50_03740 [Parachlamydiaceae bacterium]|nr:hypothetical protein [Parachlamydiaceae bacterium]
MNFEAVLETANANLNVTKINFETQKRHFLFYERLKDKKSVSEQLYQQTNYAFLAAEQSLKVSEANVKEIEVNI